MCNCYMFTLVIMSKPNFLHNFNFIIMFILVAKVNTIVVLKRAGFLLASLCVYLTVQAVALTFLSACLINGPLDLFQNILIMVSALQR